MHVLVGSASSISLMRFSLCFREEISVWNHWRKEGDLGDDRIKLGIVLITKLVFIADFRINLGGF